MNTTTTTTRTLCTQCEAGPAGEGGHGTLAVYVQGPYPGHSIFQCKSCDERWIRHCGPEGEPAWTRYGQLFNMRKPMADAAPPRRVPA